MRRPIPALEKGFWKAESKKISLRFAEFTNGQAWTDEPTGLISGRHKYIGSRAAKFRLATTGDKTTKFRFVARRPK